MNFPENVLLEALATLAKAERTVLAEYYGLEGTERLTRGEIAAKHNLSRSQVHYLLTQGREHLAKRYRYQRVFEELYPAPTKRLPK